MILKQFKSLKTYLEAENFTVYSSLDLSNDVNRVFPNAHVSFTTTNKVESEVSNGCVIILSERLIGDDSNVLEVQDQLTKQAYTMIDKINKDSDIISQVVIESGEFIKFADDEHTMRLSINLLLKSYYTPLCQ